MRDRVRCCVLSMIGALLLFPALAGCDDLPGSVTSTVLATGTSLPFVETTLPAGALTTTTLPSATTASAPGLPLITTSTTDGPALGGLQIDPGLLQPQPTLLQADPGLMLKPRRYEDTNPFLHWEWEEVWTAQANLLCSDGSQRTTSTATAWVGVSFSGHAAQLIATTSPGSGRLVAHLSGDGVDLVETIDLYSSKVRYQQAVWYSGYLPDGDYGLYFEWDPTNSPGKTVSVDAIDLWGTATPP